MKQIFLDFKIKYRNGIYMFKNLLSHPYLILLYVIFLIFGLCWGTLATMSVMDTVINYLISKNIITYAEAEKWGIGYIFVFPLLVYSIVFYCSRKLIFSNTDYFKKVCDCINYLGILALFGNQYWKIDIFKIIFGNEGFGGIVLATIWFRLILTLRDLRIPPNEVE